MTKDYQSALNLFIAKEYNEAFCLFEKLGAVYEAGYCQFAVGNIKLAKQIWENSKIDSPAINWGLSIISLINLTIPKQLSFFQIRNFLERDLDLLIKNHQIKYVENVISAADILSEYNAETYKFIGRVLLNNGYKIQSYEFFEKSRDIYYADPETHYLLAQYYISQNEYNAATKILKKSLAINPNYFPATNLLQKLQTNKLR